MDVVESFRVLVRHGRPPGPNNLVEPVAEYLQQRGSAKRGEIVAYLEDAWRRAGGEPLSGQDWGSPAESKVWIPRVKKALTKLRSADRAREATVNGGRVYGVWEWIAPQEPAPAGVVGGQTVSPGVVGSQPEASVGSGKHLLYGMYDKRRKDEARARGEDRWEVKVGMTKGNSPYDRIQDAAFLADRLVWGVAIWTDNPTREEKLLQGLLEARGRRYEGSGGREWFVTNPQEIADVYGSIVGGVSS